MIEQHQYQSCWTAGRLQEQTPKPGTFVLSFSPGEKISVARERGTIEDRGEVQSCLIRLGHYMNKVTKGKRA
jgi:hypothetical protein